MEFIYLDETKRLSLEREFDKEEIFAVLEEAESDKAPGPDGFTMGSFQKCWSVLEEDVMAFVVDFHGSCIFEKSLNATFFLVSDS